MASVQDGTTASLGTVLHACLTSDLSHRRAGRQNFLNLKGRVPVRGRACLRGDVAELKTSANCESSELSGSAASGRPSKLQVKPWSARTWQGFWSSRIDGQRASMS